MRAELTIASERWDTLWPEAQFLFAAHHEEVDPEFAVHDDYVLNESAARAMDEAGIMVISSARTRESLIGYSIWYVSPTLDSAAPCATQGPWFVLPEWRASGAGIRVFKHSLESLRARGIKRALPHHWETGNGKRLGRFFESLGATPLETTYSLWLKE